MSSRTRQATSLRSCFPLTTVRNVVDLFQKQVESPHGPDLALLSLVLGYIESRLTATNRVSTGSPNYQPENLHFKKDSSGQHFDDTVSSTAGEDGTHSSSPSTSPAQTLTINKDDLEIPPVKWETIEPLYKKFIAQTKASLDTRELPKKTNRELVKKISDTIWSNLKTSYYTSKQHLQTLYSYMTGAALDRFGVAYAVVSAFQILDLNDVRLALSEDHAWIVYGEPGNEQSAEVTWHGKGNEDKRGQPVIQTNCWLYLNGHPVLCTPQMTAAALVASLNPSISLCTESEQLATLQQKLLWLLYEKNHLNTYPMALSYLGDLEGLCPTPDATKTPVELYQEAIQISKDVYNNQHVYPFVFLANYYFRNGRFKEALQSWSDAASVIRVYNYTRDDGEIYKEFLEIANELIPLMFKFVSAGGSEPGKVSKTPLLQDPECFAALLVFYDGLCGWEEESATPVLHIGWAKQFVATMSKFTYHVRNKVTIKVRQNKDEETEFKTKDTKLKLKETESKSKASEAKEENKANNREKSPSKSSEAATANEEASSSDSKSVKIEADQSPPFAYVDSSIRTPDEMIKLIEEGLKEDGERIEANIKMGAYNKTQNELESPIVKLADDACANQALDSDSLLDISCSQNLDVTSILQNTEADFNKTSSPKNAKSDSMVSEKNAAISSSNDTSKKMSNNETEGNNAKTSAIVYLRSQKMIGLKDLLLAEKLNTSAIQLQLTAQSQVHISKRPRGSSFGSDHHHHSHHQQPEFDFLATTTIATSLSSVSGVRSSKRSRRD